MAAASTIIAGAALAYGLYSGERARSDSQAAQNKADKQADAAQAETDQQEAVSDEMAVQAKNRARQKAAAAQATTVVTPNSTGVSNSTPATSGKTLLGD